MQTITNTARVRVSLRFITVYYGQAMFKNNSILIYLYKSTRCIIQMLDVDFTFCNLNSSWHKYAKNWIKLALFKLIKNVSIFRYFNPS